MPGTRRHRQFRMRVLVPLLLVSVTSAPVHAGRHLGMGRIGEQGYKSPSGVFALRINPEDEWGKHGAAYRLTENGKEVWAGAKPYTLREVVVTDKGMVAGFAYRIDQVLPTQQERRERRSTAGPRRPPEFLHIVILWPDGTERLNDYRERVHPGYYSTPPTPFKPYLRGLTVDSDNDRMIARVQTREEGPQWWIYRLSQYEAPVRFDPRQRMYAPSPWRWVMDVKPINGTSLLLVHWYDEGAIHGVEDDGGLFTVFNGEYRPIWSYQSSHDYSELREEYPPYWKGGRNAYFRDNPGILILDTPGEFGVRIYRENQLVRFRVQKDDADEYAVTEIGRSDWPDDK